MIKQTLSAGVLALGMSIGSASSAATIDLGFIMDSSGSVTAPNFNAAMISLGDALANNIPLGDDGPDTYRIAVVRFADGAAVTSSAIVNNQTDLDNLVSSIQSTPFTGGVTNFKAAFDTLRTGFTDAFGALGDHSIVNMMTDGNPCCAGNSNAQAIVGRNDLRTAGWDSLSFEAVGDNIDLAFLQGLGYDPSGLGADLLTDASEITDPLNDAFVLEVADFGADYDAAISTKVQKIITPTIPLPAGLPLIAAGLAFFGLLGRKKARMAA